MTTIGFIGDSNTAARPANGIALSDTFPLKIGTQRGFDTIINAGIGGNTSGMMLARIQADLLCHGCGSVGISPGINDLGNAINAGSASSGVQAYRDNTLAMVDAALDAGAKVTLFTPPLVRSTIFIDNIPAYNDAIKEVAWLRGVPFVDLYFEFMQVYFTTLNTNPAAFTSLYVDAQHVSAAGHSFIRDITCRASNCHAATL
jgi:lysophospholipase L1-like esterase